MLVVDTFQANTSIAYLYIRPFVLSVSQSVGRSVGRSDRQTDRPTDRHKSFK